MLSWITTWLESLGYVGIFCLMVLEHLFPPIPSEVIMPLSGFISSQSSDMSLGGVILAGSLGSLVGTLVWYLLGRWVSQEQLLAGVEKYGRWLTLRPKDIQKAIAFFQHGGGYWVVGVGRIVPGIRTYVSVPAGLSDMPLLPYLVFTAMGSTLWTGMLAIAGYLLGSQFEEVQAFVTPISKIVLISLAILAIVWIVRRRQRQRF